MTEYDETLASLRNEYEVEVEIERYGDRDFRIHRIKDPDSLLDDDEILSASHDELAWHPYWVHAGPAAHAFPKRRVRPVR